MAYPIPDFPGLRNNRDFAVAWHRCAVASLSTHASRPSGPQYPRHLELLQMASSEYEKEQGIETKLFKWDQFNVVPSRHPDKGSSCCGHFVAKMIMIWSQPSARSELFRSWNLARYWRPKLESAVKYWDRQGHALCADVLETVKDSLADAPAHVAWEKVSLGGSSALAALFSTSPPYAAAITARLASSSEQERDANSFGVFADEVGDIIVVDTHRHFDEQGNAQGTLCAKIPGSTAALAKWIYTCLLPRARCSDEQLDIGTQLHG